VNSEYVDRIIDIDSSKLGPCPWHFNCGMIEDGDGYLLAYRCSEAEPHLRTVHLNKDFIPDPSTDQRISFVNEKKLTYYEDPRIFISNDEKYISYTNYCYNSFYCWVGYNKIEYDKQLVPINPRFKANSWAGGIEKNWSFFDYLGKIHFVYSVNPHIVCESNGSHEPAHIYESRIAPVWNYGVKRGGAPSILFNGQYYHFFHSRSDDSGKALYHIGLYTFEDKPPFRITGIIKEPILTGWEYNAHDKAVVFPCGAIHKDGKWIVSRGFNDMACKIAIFDHEKLTAKLEAPTHYRRVACLRDRNVGVPCGWRYGNYIASSWTGLRSRVPSEISDEEIEGHICLKLIESGADRFVSEKWIL